MECGVIRSARIRALPAKLASMLRKWDRERFRDEFKGAKRGGIRDF
jgi:hypothetical protein